MDARAGLEAACAALAAKRREQPDLERMTNALDRRFAAHDANDVESYIAADTEFHHAVIDASHNPILIRLHAAVSELMDSSIVKTVELPEDPSVGVWHRNLYSAIEAQNAISANEAAYQAIASVKKGFSE